MKALAGRGDFDQHICVLKVKERDRRNEGKTEEEVYLDYSKTNVARSVASWTSEGNIDRKPNCVLSCC